MLQRTETDMTEQERVRVEEELVFSLNPDQLVLEGLERIIAPVVPNINHDEFIDGLGVGIG